MSCQLSVSKVFKHKSKFLPNFAHSLYVWPINIEKVETTAKQRATHVQDFDSLAMFLQSLQSFYPT